MKTIIGIVDDRAKADNLIRAVEQLGVSFSDITLLMPGDPMALNGVKEAAESTNGVASSAKGIATGGAIGMMLGLGALAIPGVAPLVLAGAGVTALTAILTGGAGGILGALLGSSVPEANIPHYQKRLHDGGFLIAARADNEELAERVHGTFVSGGAEDIVIAPAEPAAATL